MTALSEWKKVLLAWALLLGGPLFAGPVLADWPPPSYEAVYDIYMDGKPRMETRVSFTREANRWRFENTGQGTKGLARFLRAATTDSASGTWEGVTTLPATFQHDSKVAGRHDIWSAQFDWQAGTVLTRHEEGESELPLEPGTVDPLGLTLALQSRINQGLTEWELKVVDEDEIDQHRYRAMPREQVQTALGCLEAVEVERVRENSKRYSSVWYAPELSFITVFMQHGKRGKHDFEMRIRELKVDGQAIPAREACQAGG
jgi:hypothetical protein